MNCWECRDMIRGAARQGVLPEAAAEHLAHCRACRDFAAQLAAVESILSRWPAPTTEGAAVREAVVARLAAPPPALEPAPRRLFARLVPLPARLVAGTAAAALLLVILGLAFTRWGNEREPSGLTLPSRQGDDAAARMARLPHARHPAKATRRTDAPRTPAAGGMTPRSPRFSSNTPGPDRPVAAPPLPPRHDRRQEWPRRAVPPPPRSVPHPGIAAGDLVDLNGAAARAPRPSGAPSADAWTRIETRLRGELPVRDDFVRVPFPRLASASDRAVAAAVESYRREAAVVDDRLFREVTVQRKATALSDLCERLRADTGIALVAGSSVADEKVTLFCRTMPLREVMRQLSRPFGYAWLRRGKRREYQYELAQDLRSQLLEEELRNRDRNEALLALEREIERYRPYLGLSPDEAQARAKVAAPAEKKLMENLAGLGWGPIQMYFRLSHDDMTALRAGQRLRFSTAPKPGEGPQRPLPPDLRRGVLECNRGWRVVKDERGFGLTADPTDPRSVATTTLDEVHAQVTLDIVQSELGVFTLGGQSGFFMERQFGTLDSHGPLATGMSPSVRNPQNGAANAGLARDPALRARVSLRPQASCGRDLSPSPSPRRGGEQLPLPASGRGQGGEVNPRVTSADVLEALHQATGLSIVSDYYTRLYKPAEVSVGSRPLFDALNHLADTMRLRWNKEGAWLQFRSTSYYHDRLKEVPNRLLARWSAAREQHGALTLEELVEIAQLPDAQLDATEMAEGARDCFGLAEWSLARNGVKRRDLRFLATFTPEQRQAAMSAAGLPFTRMSLAQQQRYLSLAFGPDDEPLQSLDELTGAILRVDYSLAGMFEWRVPGPPWLQWVVPLAPGTDGRRVPRPPVRERTRESALQALRQVDPQIRQAVLQAAGRADPRLVGAPPSEEAQIVPSQTDLAIIYIPGASNRRAVRARFAYNDQDSSTR
jgi:hypothetical protein